MAEVKVHPNEHEAGDATWDRDNWAALQDIFHAVERADPADRAALIERSTDDPVMRDRVLSLLASTESLAATEPLGGTAIPIGRRIGPYAVLRHLGTGGVGSVYLSERVVAGAVQRCAIKVLALHATGPGFEARFQREQQILASLNHPEITRLLDAGISDTGQPYMVMEYVEGVDLSTYCDDQKLTVLRRIDLFLRICEAVSYAHRNLTVHLDLKPSNILITPDGCVKLLDFGTAKLIDPDHGMTTTVMVTPAYASPEQLRGQAVTTSCDVYSLGAILFELLTGQRPFHSASVAMVVERALREEEPSAITTAVTEAGAGVRGTSTERLRQMLEGDLATIVARCLRSRPADRYTSVEALSEDLRRYRDGRPVLARPQTQMYRLGKFIRRNRVAVAATALATFATVGSLSYGAVRQHEALRDAKRAVQMQSFMSQLFKLANTNYMGKPAATVPEFLQLGARVLPEMIHSPADQRAAGLSLAESMYNNGDFHDAQALLAQIIQEAKSAGDDPVEAEAEGYGGRVAYKLGDIPQYRALSTHALALAHRPGVTPSARVWIETFYVEDRSEEAYLTKEDLDLQRAALKEARSGSVPESELAYALLNLAFALQQDGTVEEQRALGEEALAIYQHQPYAVCDRAGAQQLLGVLGQQTNDPQVSVKYYRLSVDGYRQCSGPDGRDALEVSGYLGLALVATQQAPEAITLLEDTIVKLERVAGPDSLILKVPLLGLARAYLDTAQFEKSAVTAARLLQVVNGKVNPLSSEMGAYQAVWAQALVGTHRDGEALQHAELADKAYRTANSKIVTAQVNAVKIHELMLDLQRRTGNQ